MCMFIFSMNYLLVFFSPSLSLWFKSLLQANCSPSSGTSSLPRSRKPGAIIESFVNHAPGVFSGTFSGERTLSYC